MYSPNYFPTFHSDSFPATTHSSTFIELTFRDKCTEDNAFHKMFPFAVTNSSSIFMSEYQYNVVLVG